jgi:hypothetical protein
MGSFVGGKAVTRGVILTIIRKVIIRIFRFVYTLNPEQDTLCSEALDESALVLKKSCGFLFERTRSEKSVQLRVVGVTRRWTDRVELTVVIFHGSTNITPNKTCPSVI